MNVVCTNEECSEFEILKDNSIGNYPVEEIQCGKCGGPVEEEVAEDG